MNKIQTVTALWDLRSGETAWVTGFDAALSASYQGRMMEFGFQPGTRVQCQITPGFGAPRVYAISNSVFSLDREIARSVYVSRVEPAEVGA